MRPVVTPEGLVVCSVDGKTLHLDRQSWADATRLLGHHAVRLTCGDHDTWMPYRAPPPELRITKMIPGTGKPCAHCHEPLEAKRQHLALIHLHCRAGYGKAKRAAGAERRSRANLHTKPGALARLLHEQTMAGPRIRRPSMATG